MCNQSSYMSPKDLVHAHSGFTQVLFVVFNILFDTLESKGTQII